MQADFQAPERYRPVRTLGEGGMGRVYEVLDTERDRPVALKTLLRADPLALFLFKNEFRALSDLAHPNLVGLYELAVAGDTPFFTMELVPDGVDLLRAVRGESHASGRSWLTAAGDLDPDATLPPTHDAPSVDIPLPAPSPLEPTQLQQLRTLMGQLADALATLHANRKLHRDIKPSNVLVTTEGRLVLLDFGLVASLDPSDVAHTGQIAGSVPYMSPEQSIGAELTPASDWYAFGAVLYELLTGRPPFAGARAAVLAAKRGREVVPPSLVVPGVPQDLDTLCVRLLALDPAERPSADHVLVVLGRTPRARRPDAPDLVGRTPHLEQLDEALEAVRRGRQATVHLQGASGMGKSALAHAFLDRVGPDSLTLKARCYERDHIPFKAIDPLVDALVPWLANLPSDQAAALAPRHARALARLFPVLDRVEAFSDAVQRTAPAADPREEQRRAFEGLRELLARVGEQLLLVVHIDDLQWADRDSADVLRNLLRPPDPPVMLLVLSYRTETLDGNFALKLLPAGSERRVQVGPLDDADVGTLVRAVWPDADSATTERITTESAGSPFFAIELAHRAHADPGSDSGLQSLIDERVQELPESARQLLDTVALASVPLPREVALTASNAPPTALMALKAARLVRSVGGHKDELLECYHDRIRETVVAGLADPKPMHRHLAEALERHGETDAEQLCGHWRRAGDSKKAARFARIAAEEATEQLAFDRASANLRVLLELLGPDSDERGVLLTRLAESLESAGRGREAADALLAAGPIQRDRSLTRRAAFDLLWSGHLKRGRELLIRVLTDVGAPMPTTKWGLMLTAIWHRLKSRLRRLQFTPRSFEDDQLERVETLRATGFALVISDQDLAFATLARFITEARALGDPRMFAYSMAAETFIAHLEPWGTERSHQAYELGVRIATEMDDSESLAMCHQWRAIALVQIGHVDEALQLFDHSEELFLTRIPMSATMLGWVRMFQAAIAGYQRGWAESARIMRTVIADAQVREDLALEVHTVLGIFNSADLIAGDPEAAEALVESTFAKWQSDRFDLMHFYANIMRLVIWNYRGEYTRSWKHVQAIEADMKASGAFQSGANLSQWWCIASASVAGAAQQGAASRKDLRRAVDWVERGLKTSGWRMTVAAWSGSAVYYALGDTDRARSLLDQARAVYRMERMDNFELSIDLLHMQIRGADRTDAAYLRALEALKTSGLAEPEKMVAAFGPILP